MENKILRLVVLHDEKNEVLGFVVLKENGTEKYGFGESLDEKKNHYNKLMNELVRTYPEGLETLIENKDTKKIRNFLVENGYIIDTNDDVITKLTAKEDEEEPYFEIEYALNDKEVISCYDYENDDEFMQVYNDTLKSIERTYRIVNANKFKGLVNIIKLPKKKETKKEKDYDDDFDDDFDDDYEEEKSKEYKKLKYTRKLAALVTAGAVLVVTGIGIGAYKLGKKKNEEKNVDSTPELTLEFNSSTPLPFTASTSTPTTVPTSTPTPTPTVAPTKIPTSVPTFIPISTPYVASHPMTNEELRLEPTPYPMEAYNPSNSKELWTTIIPNQGEDVVNIGDVDLSTIDLQELYTVSYQNMWDLSNHIFHGEDNQNLETSPMRIHFERIIPGLSEEEKAYIKYFSDLRNEIVYQGYNLGENEKVLRCNNYTVYELIRCIKYNNPLRLKIDNKEEFVRFSDLSYEAQDAIEQICWGNYLLMGDTTVEFNGDYYDQASIGLDIFGLSQEETPKF